MEQRAVRFGRWTVTLDLADDNGLSISCQAGGATVRLLAEVLRPSSPAFGHSFVLSHLSSFFCVFDRQQQDDTGGRRGRAVQGGGDDRGAADGRRSQPQAKAET